MTAPRRWLATIAAAALLAGCGGSDPGGAPATARAAAPAAGTYVGHVPGSDAYLAVVLDRDRAAGYLCDRGTTAAWFPHRPHRDGRARLRSRSRRATLSLEPAAGGLRARVRLPEGSTRTLMLAPASGRAGLYRATARTRRGGLEAGWVVLTDGRQRGATTRFIDPLGDLARTTTTAAPPLDTATGTVKFAVPGAGTSTVSKLTQPGVIDIDLDR